MVSPDHVHVADPQWVRPVLTRLGVALTRRRSYGPTHPMVHEAEQALVTALHPMLSAGTPLAIGVAQSTLLIDGRPFEEGGVVAHDLAERLHRRGVGALSIQRGVTAEGLQSLLAWLSLREDTESPPPSAPGITVGRVAYDRLVLADTAATQAEVDAVWQALAAAAFEETLGDTGARHVGIASDATLGDLPDGSLAAKTPGEVADAVRAHAQRRDYAERFGAMLGVLGTRVAKAPPGVREVIGGWLQQVLARLDASTVVSIVSAAGGGRAQRRLVASVVEALPLSAVVEWLDVAGKAANQELSHHLLRLLSKLSAHAGRAGARAWTPDAFRDAARNLVHGWDLGDPNPGEHAALLDHIARLGATDAGHVALDRVDRSVLTDDLPSGSVSEAFRLVQMACELGEASDDALASVDTLMAAGRARDLLSCLEHAPASTAVSNLRTRIFSPDALNAALCAEPFDADTARQLLAETDSSLAPALLDALEAAGSRTARRLIFDRLRHEGPSLFPALEQRLSGNPPWYFARNLLALLREIGKCEGKESGASLALLATYQTHSQEQVRLEALRLLAQDPRARDAALCRALRDESGRVVTAAIDATLAAIADDQAARVNNDGAARLALSRDLATRLMSLVDDSRSDEGLRARAVRALVAAPGPTVRGWLVQLVSTRSRLLGRIKLAPSRPTVDAAFELLAEQYARDDEVRRVLARAGRTVK